MQERSVSANTKIMRNGQLTFLSSSVTVRNYSCSQRIGSQAEYVISIIIFSPRADFRAEWHILTFWRSHMFIFLFSLGTIPDDYSISYESDRRSPCTLLSRRRNQSGTPPPPPAPINSNPIKFFDDLREWINEPNGWYITRWST